MTPLQAWSMEDYGINRTVIVPILGSYDPETKNILYRVKEEIAKLSTILEDIDLLPLLLEEAEIYLGEQKGQACTIMVEKYSENKYTLIFIEKPSVIKDVVDIEAHSLEELEEKLEHDYSISFLTRVPIYEKLRLLAKDSITIVIRHKEETRCGEIVEVLLLLAKPHLRPKIVYFMYNDKIKLSYMVSQLLRAVGIAFFKYKDLEELLGIVWNNIMNLIAAGLI